MRKFVRETSLTCSAYLLQVAAQSRRGGGCEGLGGDACVALAYPTHVALAHRESNHVSLIIQ
jgi:hypothetical protein